jgi:hypothetical protein
VFIIYSCHSLYKRVQFSISEGAIRSFIGRFAKRAIIHRASSMSRNASMKVGYLNIWEICG